MGYLVAGAAVLERLIGAGAGQWPLLLAACLFLLVLRALWQAHIFNPYRRYPGEVLVASEVRTGTPLGYTGDPIPCRNPATGELLGEERAATEAEVRAVCARAAAAQKIWAQTPFEERRLVLADLLEAVVLNQDELCHMSSLETGKSRFDAMMGEVAVTCEKLRYTMRYGEEALKPESRRVPVFFRLGGKWAQVEYSPLGVIGAIIPWNYPVHNFLSPVISALFAGNACVVKASEWACWSRRPLEALVRRVLARRGHSPDLVALLPGYGATGAALVRSPDVAKVLFIGSPETGKRVMAAAAQDLKPVILELGGKDPMVVMSPCDVALAADRALNGAFFNLGQNCIAAERVLVHAPLLDQFLAHLLARLPNIDQGVSGRDFGSMTMPQQRDKVHALVQDAIKNGARLLWGGKMPPPSEKGLFYPPTVLLGVNPNCKLWLEEAFGPVMIVLPFEGEGEAVALANGTPFGLGASVASDDLAAAQRIADKIDSGMCVINDYGLSYMLQDLPFGGCKDSGFGRFNGPEGLRDFSRLKSVVGVHWNPPSGAAFPWFMRRPVPSVTVPLLREALRLFYAWGLAAKARALARLLALLAAPNQKRE